MAQTEMELYLAIRNNNLSRVVDILKRHDLSKREFFNGTITFVSLAVMHGMFVSEWSRGVALAQVTDFSRFSRQSGHRREAH